MSELAQLTLAIVALVPSIYFGYVSSLGGRAGLILLMTGRVWKRLLAPIGFVSLLIAFALISEQFSWWLLTLYITYFLSCMVGYGGNSIFTKLWRRSIWTILRSLACLPLVILTENYSLFLLQLSVGAIATLILGLRNPLKASAEEFLINFISVVFVAYMLL